MAGKLSPTTCPSRAFLRVAVLEMEKERRGRERDSAVRRVKSIEARFAEIEAEKAELLEATGETLLSRPRRRANGPGLQPEGVKLRY